MTEKIKHIIVRYLTNSTTLNDLDTLSEWIKNPENEQIFNDYVQTHYAINHIMNNEESEETLERLLRTIRKEKTLLYRLKNQAVYKYAIAASITILLSLSIFVKKENNIPEDTAPIIINNQIESGSNKAILTLEDGSEITLTKGNTYAIKNATSNGEEIVYQPAKDASSLTSDSQSVTNNQIAYNYLTIPRGGEYKIVLPDGTKVWLNSETQLKYPVQFIEGETRQVELVYGEAYFDVSPSTAHAGASFKVFNKNQEVNVLGTEFNIKAYRNESVIYTTLVEGKVRVTAGKNNKTLAPSQQAIVNVRNNTMQVIEVDVYDEISWKDGVFSFNKKNLKEIMQVLARWYDMKVTFKNKELENAGFNGALGREQNIEEILETIKSFGVVKNYEINNKSIIIN
ncbi:DUF4974 domain-containing protein [Flavobacteriaceae bacterium F08102]|nr:DUF4974 domain-containing protein [Flavobacteriaceae bacterium F08102]